MSAVFCLNFSRRKATSHLSFGQACDFPPVGTLATAEIEASLYIAPCVDLEQMRDQEISR